MGATRSAEAVRASGAFDWLQWWEANRWRYLSFLPVTDVPTSSNDLMVGRRPERTPLENEPLAGRARESAVAKLREIAGSTNERMAIEALAALASVAGVDSLPDLKKAVAGNDTNRRLAAIRAASRLTAAGGIDELKAVIKDASRDPLERGTAAVVLGLLGDSPSFDLLKSLAMNSDEKLEARTGAILALGISAGDPGVEVLSSVLRSQKEVRLVRLAAAFALGRSGDKHAVPALTEVLRDSDAADLRRAAASSLGALAIRRTHPLDGEARTEAAESLIGAARKDADAGVRSLAVLSLGQIGSADAKLECRRILGQGPADLVIPAMLSLAILGDPLDGEVIAPYLRSSPTFQAPAALACGLLRYAPVLDNVRNLFEESRDRMVRQCAAVSLGFLRDSASVAPVSKWLGESRDGDDVEAAIHSLGLMGLPASRAALRRLADEGPSADVRAQAIEMLGRIRDFSEQSHLEATAGSSSRSEEERLAAVRALGFLGAPARYLPPIRDVLCDRDYDLKGVLLRNLIATL